MADYVNPQTCQVAMSVNTRTDPWVQITRDLSLAWSAIPQGYRKWVADHIEEMSGPEKAAVDLAAQNAGRDATVQQLDEQEDILRAFAQMVMDEFNLHAQRTNAILTAIDNGANIGAIKTAVGQIQDLPTRTLLQLRTAIRNKIGS